jgi:hypothetical protein
VSEENVNANATAERKFTSVNGKPLGETQGDLKFISAGKLFKEGITGVVAQGLYEGAKEIDTKYGKKQQYSVRQDDGSLVLLDGAGNLGSQMDKVQLGAYVQISYMGKDTITSGQWKGNQSHKYIVGVEAE